MKKIYIPFLILALIIATSFFPIRVKAAYSFQETLTINHLKVPSDQTNFTVLATTTDTTLKVIGSGGNVQNASGFDITYSSTVCTAPTLLKWENEYYDGTTGKRIDWILITSLSSSVDTVIYRCYGDPTISTFQGGVTGSAWDSNYKGVWHEPDGTTLSAVDSLGVSNGTVTGATAGTGQIDGAAALSGSSQYIDVGNTSNLQIIGDITIEAWVNPTDRSNYNGIMGKTTGNVPTSYDFYLVQGSGIPDFFRGNGTSAPDVAGTNPVPSGVFSHIVVTESGTTVTHYLNGAANGSGSAVVTPSDGGTNALIGSRADHATMFKGAMDEIRISNIARSADWITTEYNNQVNVATFITTGGSTPISSGGVSIPVVALLGSRMTIKGSKVIIK